MQDSHKERELLVQLQKAKDEAEGSVSALINIAKENEDFYYGMLPLPDVEGGSEATDKIVWQHVEGATTQILPIFTSMENKAVEFTPRCEKDVLVARALTHHISEKILYKNNGKEILETAIREAFINRIAWIKTTWETKIVAEQEAFSDITKAQLKKFKKDKDVVEVKSDKDDKYSGHIITYTEKSDLKMDNVPLTNMLFPASVKDLDSLTYICQRQSMMRGDLIEMFGEEKIDALGSNNEYTSNTPSLNNVDGFTTAKEVNSDNNDKSTDRFDLYEHYILTSHLTDGSALQWVQAFTCNDNLLEYCVVKDNPFSAIVAVAVPNSVVGWSIPDLIKDIQKQRTAIMRAATSNTLNLAYPRYIAEAGKYDSESLVDNSPGAVVEADHVGAVIQFQETPLPAQSYEQLDRLTLEAQKITGISDMNQGLDPNVLKGTNAAATVIAQMNAGTKRVLGYAKSIANGWKDVVEKSYNYIRENSNKIDYIGVDGKSYIISHADMVDRPLTLSTLFGQDENLQEAQLLMAMADRFMSNPALSKSYNPYYMESAILERLGIKDRHLILKDPKDIPPDPTEIMLQQMQMQMQQMQLRQQELSLQMLGAQTQQIQQNTVNDTARVNIEQTKVAGDQQYNAEKVITDRGHLQVAARKVDLDVADLQQRGEIEAVRLNLDQVKVQHQATMDLNNIMQVPMEISHEQALGQPTKLGN